MKNYICFGGRFRLSYAYFDSHSYVADSLFYKHEIPVKFKSEYVNEEEDYRVIFCSIKRKDKEKFERALLELHNKMLICGHNDYEDFCEKLMGYLEEEKE